MDRPSKSPDPSQRRQVEAMAGYGIPEEDIARVLDIDRRMLRDLYGDALDTGHVVANAKVAESLFRKATGDHRQSVTAAVFWLKTRAGWKEGADPQPGGPGTQTQIEIVAASRQLEERLDAMARRMRVEAA